METSTRGEQGAIPFKPDARLYVAFLGLVVMTLMVALDGMMIPLHECSLHTSFGTGQHRYHNLGRSPYHRKPPRRLWFRDVLDGNLFHFVQHRLSTSLRVIQLHLRPEDPGPFVIVSFLDGRNHLCCCHKLHHPLGGKMLARLWRRRSYCHDRSGVDGSHSFEAERNFHRDSGVCLCP